MRSIAYGTIPSMKRVVCISCGKKERIHTVYNATFVAGDLTDQTYSARRRPDRIHYKIVECRRCGLIFSSPVLDDNTIVSLYQKSVCSYEHLIPYTTKTYLGLFGRIQNSLPARPKVLEVGCGNGFFLSALVASGIKNVWGVEPGRKMVDEAPGFLRGKIKTDIFKPGQFRPTSFDLVCCFHTLDHMSDPIGFAKEAFRILARGGFVIVVVHDVEGISVKLFGERSPIFDIEHTYFFSKKTISQLLRNEGFTIRDVSDLANTYPLSYWLSMSSIPGFLKDIGVGFLARAPVLDRALTMSGGNMYIIAQKQY